jgi:leucyl-tRNA synthetase
MKKYNSGLPIMYLPVMAQGVVMAVPSSDDRDFRFATYYGLPVKRVIGGTENLADPTEIKHGKMINSGFITGMDSKDAVKAPR